MAIHTATCSVATPIAAPMPTPTTIQPAILIGQILPPSSTLHQGNPASVMTRHDVPSERAALRARTGTTAARSMYTPRPLTTLVASSDRRGPPQRHRRSPHPRPAEHVAYRHEAAAAGGDAVADVDRAGSLRRERSRLARLHRARPDTARTLGEHARRNGARASFGIEGAEPLASPRCGYKGYAAYDR